MPVPKAEGDELRPREPGAPDERLQDTAALRADRDAPVVALFGRFPAGLVIVECIEKVTEPVLLSVLFHNPILPCTPATIGTYPHY